MSLAALSPSLADRPSLEMALTQVFAPWVQMLDLSLIAAWAGEIHLALPVAPRHVHVGGVLCGQTLMAAADTAMVLAVMTHKGKFVPMTTVQLQTSFLRPVPGDSGSVTVVARVLKLGRNLAFGEVELRTARGELAAHATSTCALL